MEKNTEQSIAPLGALDRDISELSLIAPKLSLLAFEQHETFFSTDELPENGFRILWAYSNASIRHQIMADYVQKVVELSETLYDTLEALCAEKREGSTPKAEQADSEQADPSEPADGPVAKIKELLRSLPPDKKLDFCDYVRFLADTPSEAEAVQ